MHNPRLLTLSALHPHVQVGTTCQNQGGIFFSAVESVWILQPLPPKNWYHAFDDEPLLILLTS